MATYEARQQVIWNHTVGAKLRGQADKHGKGPFTIRAVSSVVGLQLQLDTLAEKGIWLDADLFIPVDQG